MNPVWKFAETYACLWGKDGITLVPVTGSRRGWMQGNKQPRCQRDPNSALEKAVAATAEGGFIE